MDYTNIFYVLASVLFILGIKKLSHPKTARNGNFLSALGMFVAIVSTLLASEKIDLQMIMVGMIIGSVIGALFAQKVEMTQMPQMVAIFNGFGGSASALVAAAGSTGTSAPTVQTFRGRPGLTTLNAKKMPSKTVAAPR